MNVLIVHAHPEPQSFTTSMMKTAVEEFTRAGHAVEVSDLYAMNWNPVASAADFGSRKNPDYLVYALEQRHAWEAGTLAPDIVAEVQKLQKADLVIFNFPVYWFSVPAILKGWIDRVFALDVAYGGGRWFDRGVYRGKRALVACTTGARADRFSADGLFGPLDWVLHPLRVGTLNFCGFDTLEPFVGWAAGHLGDAQRDALLASWRDRLAGVESEPPQPFRHLTDFPDPGMRDHRS